MDSYCNILRFFCQRIICTTAGHMLRFFVSFSTFLFAPVVYRQKRVHIFVYPDKRISPPLRIRFDALSVGEGFYPSRKRRCSGNENGRVGNPPLRNSLPKVPCRGGFLTLPQTRLCRKRNGRVGNPPLRNNVPKLLCRGGFLTLPQNAALQET